MLTIKYEDYFLIIGIVEHFFPSPMERKIKVTRLTKQRTKERIWSSVTHTNSSGNTPKGGNVRVPHWRDLPSSTDPSCVSAKAA